MHKINLTTCGPLGAALREQPQSCPLILKLDGDAYHVELAQLERTEAGLVLDLTIGEPIHRESHEDEPDPGVEVTAEEEAERALDEGAKPQPAPTIEGADAPDPDGTPTESPVPEPTPAPPRVDADGKPVPPTENPDAPVDPNTPESAPV